MGALEEYLAQVKSRYHQKSFVSSDPLSFVYLYQDPMDQEAVAVISALLSYGNVKQIKNSIRQVLTIIESMSQSPSYFVRALADSDFYSRAAKRFKPFVHRFNSGNDMLVLLRLLSKSWSKYGSMGAHFLTYLNPNDQTVENALNEFIGEFKSSAKQLKAGESFYFLLNAPQDGSACKRWCMLLRWMGRSDEIDPGLWTSSSDIARQQEWKKFLKANQLVIPVDTHIGKIAKYISLTDKQSVTWKVALEITQSLREISPEDPTQYDFSLSRLGILSVMTAEV